ncbi:MAG: hypothetical protein HQL31_14080, partial [Planctomycetes bacterium]|nr:hypothetical protein [Planctomycetota bacterium]
MDFFLPIVRFLWEGQHRPEWREPQRKIYDCELLYLSRGSFTLKIGDES